MARLPKLELLNCVFPNTVNKYILKTPRPYGNGLGVAYFYTYQLVVFSRKNIDNISTGYYNITN